MDLKISRVTKLFGKQKALDDVSFSVGKGELLGFLGPNGAGKSTLMKIITGFLPANSGEVWMDNQKVSADNTSIRRNIGYLPEHNPLYTELYVREYLEISAGFYHMKDKKRQVERMVELTGLGNEQHKKIGMLSKGYRQRVGLAQALIHDPEVLILDEPTSGLDPNQLEDIRGLIRDISREKTVIFSTHIMPEVEAVCNRVLIINKGEIVADGSISDIKKAQLIRNQTVVAAFDKQVLPEKLHEIEGVKSIIFENGQWKIEADGNEDIRPAIFRFAVQNNLTLLTLFQKQQNLESIFQRLTRGN
ncbi:gliding motility-associated ABC transporter ATP-binding subunit GldA [Mariniphaga sediminis]|uniref:Gliding motility-associated ABC transporter ATP-binding subunit GldA n=1 Tax=Mariniphaga sediminis TaxID=1628158 RepID=A0A399D346_9BACT|nr:gliding motility-associated ABC transporter ATP-binding subunit GldA [Mariniphaga sediminis]RIH65896.1 gliding motility-associated ABC transporter ATP-binding subunit GldA [Mariniphaga sediminis]